MVADTAARPDPRVTAEAALLLARTHFLHGDRIDMGSLAVELSISRATLYRWVGDRDRLIGGVIWSFTEPFLEQLSEATRDLTGIGRLVVIMRELGYAVLGMEPVGTFLHRDPVGALRILTTGASELQPNMIEYFATVLREEIETGALPAPVDIDVDSLAYAVLRIAETFFYADVIARRPADADKAATIVGLMLAGIGTSLPDTTTWRPAIVLDRVGVRRPP
jgi:hypothetical protein